MPITNYYVPSVAWKARKPPPKGGGFQIESQAYAPGMFQVGAISGGVFEISKSSQQPPRLLTARYIEYEEHTVL